MSEASIRIRHLYFCQVDEAFLQISHKWFEDTDFRNLIMAATPDRDAQIAWLAALNSRQDYKIWGVKHMGHWVGAFGLKGISSLANTAEYWGYIYPKELRQLGIGHEMFCHSCRYAIAKELQVVWLRVSPKNIRAIEAYTRWGFLAASSSAEEIYMVKQL